MDDRVLPDRKQEAYLEYAISRNPSLQTEASLKSSIYLRKSKALNRPGSAVAAITPQSYPAKNAFDNALRPRSRVKGFLFHPHH